MISIFGGDFMSYSKKIDNVVNDLELDLQILEEYKEDIQEIINEMLQNMGVGD